ncbi:MAG TPA: TonB family protein [Vicinamibacteria bacterium]|nr:TonB family protein [Vicinamibacteria bacterium]
MRHATVILIAASLSAAAPQKVASQEPASPPAAVPSPAPAAPPAAPSNVKVAGRDVPAPKRTRFVSPVFPLEAQAAGQRGIVIIELVIDEAGKVSTADVLRSVPPFDEAALTAARQWEYEITKVDGKPVPVRLTVPITFALKLPDMTREAGIPELRQGATPGFPIGAKGPAKVVADVTLQPDGTVAEAAIKEGDSPYAEAMLLTLRTWRFASEAEAPPVAFQVRAEFVPGPPPRVELKLSGLRTAERRPADTPSAEATPAPPTIAPSPSAVATPAPAPATPAPATPPPAVPALATPTPAPATPAPTTPTPTTTTATPPPPVVNAPPAPLPRPEAVRPSPVVPTPPPVEVIPGGPASQPSPAPGTAATPGAVPGVPATPPSPAPRSEPGVSAVRDVALGPGVPDLTKGRRPVAPPLARMSSLSGAVQVQFSIDASGSSSIQSVNGPDLLKEAARQAVATWNFRRTSAERVYLVATFNYDGDKAQAEVKRAE